MQPRYRALVIYGLALALLIFLLKWLEWKFIVMDHTLELYSGALAVVFTGLGIWLALRLAKPKVRTVVVAPPVVDETAAARWGLSARELEVLQLMGEGLTNQEIAVRLFVSLNTVKTHAASIFSKLDVRSRTQAIAKARQLGIKNHPKG
ncbi:response regulator transcription factor [Dinghuibacter silviterrae]|uniref:Regulatory LuxR family protein n=1 Tax=Dinghuibacter silviterrae TaxID=1539049 RepID=A0A4R8DFV6_9BACT|nr:response regulator transcription factor [Dinghuibacter silviterrae]TDW96228.1 regulatory LuxR family protein [Dinghuibacter silviterrae]